MSDLFDRAADRLRSERAPLADRMRPRILDEYVGQSHILGESRLLRRAIEADRLSSILLFGPPGTGKTTLARIIANTTKAHFVTLNAVLSGVKDIRGAITEATDRLKHHGQRTILFIDEVHRFNKAQQDALLPHVENGTVTLIGATTENPYFEVIKALVSRSRVFELKTLTEEDLAAIAHQAISSTERGFGRLNIRIEDKALDHLVNTSNGDARSLLNALELAVETTPETAVAGSATPDQTERYITLQVAEESIQKRAVLYDREGDAHYDTISAFIKSLRGSDPDAALYWMARMVYAGEDPRFIFRRMLIFAAEDIGLADPRALQMAITASQAFDYVGMPEGRFILSECCLYLATAPKSNSTYTFFDALRFVEKEQSGEVPNHLKDASRDGKGLGHGENYNYPHAYRAHYVPQQYLPDDMQGVYFYEPSGLGFEKTIAERLEYFRSRDQGEGFEKRVARYAENDIGDKSTENET
jgi:putative ATPase